MLHYFSTNNILYLLQGRNFNCIHYFLVIVRASTTLNASTRWAHESVTFSFSFFFVRPILTHFPTFVLRSALFLSTSCMATLFALIAHFNVHNSTLERSERKITSFHSSHVHCSWFWLHLKCHNIKLRIIWEIKVREGEENASNAMLRVFDFPWNFVFNQH